MKRETVSRIATQLVEGGINTHHMVKIVAESQGVSLDDVRRIKTFLKGQGLENAVSYCDAIANGWEDERLNLEA